METGVLIAIITASSALLVALINALFQRGNTKELRDFQRRMGLFDQSRKFQIDEFQAKRDALTDSCRSIQKFRDELQIIANKTQPLIYQEEQQRLIAARDDLLATYEKCYIKISEKDRNLFHKVKGKVIEACALLQDKEVWAGGLLIGKEGHSQVIERIRSELADYQNSMLLSSLTYFQRSLSTMEDLLHEPREMGHFSRGR